MKLSNYITKLDKLKEYTIKTAGIVEQIIMTINFQFTHNYSMNKGIKELETKGYNAAYEKLKQLHNHIYSNQFLSKNFHLSREDKQ